MKEYYYLEKANKIGPVSEDELLKLNLSSETLIWEESLENWTKISEITILNKKIPPPPPKAYLEENRKKSKKVGKSFLVLISLLLIAVACTYVLINQRIKDSRNELISKIETVFSGKSMICDGTNYRVEGELKRHYFQAKAKPSSGLDFSVLHPIDLNDNELTEPLKKRGYYDYYTLNQGGFDIKKLTKIDNGYELEHIFSLNMVYTNFSNYRPSIQKSYTDVYDQIIEGNKGCYSQNSFKIIENFTRLNSDYHRLENVTKPSTPNSHFWWYDNMYYYNTYRRVYYKQENRYYEITVRDYYIEDLLKRVGLIELGSILLVFFILLILNPFKW